MKKTVGSLSGQAGCAGGCPSGAPKAGGFGRGRSQRTVLFVLFSILLGLSLVGTGSAAGKKEAAEPGAAGGSESSRQGSSAGTPRTAEPLTVRIGTFKGPTGFGMIRMFETPPDLGSGMQASLVAVATPDIMIARLLSGEVDIASLPTNVAAKLYVKGVPVQLGAITGYGVLYLVARDVDGAPDTGSGAGAGAEVTADADPAAGSGSGADAEAKPDQDAATGQDARANATSEATADVKANVPADTDPGAESAADPVVAGWEFLAGKTVYNTGRGSTPEFVFEYLLEKNPTGAAAPTVDYTYGPQELAQVFIAGRVNVAVLPEPFVTKVLKSVPEARIVLDLQEEWRAVEGGELSYPMSAVVIRKGFAARNPEVVRRFLSAYGESIAWVNSNPEPAGKLVAKHGLGMSADEATEAIPRLNLVFLAASDVRSEVDEFLTVLLDSDADSVGGRLPDDGFFYQE